MPEPDPDQTPTITVPAAATAPVRSAPVEPVEPVESPPESNGSHASVPASLPTASESLRPEERAVPPPPPTSAGLPSTSPAIPAQPSSPRSPQQSARRISVVAPGSRWVIIHPHVSYFGWLADKQGPADATPDERLDHYRRESPWLFRTCVVLDLLVLFVVTSILVVALAAVLYKAIWGVV